MTLFSMAEKIVEEVENHIRVATCGTALIIKSELYNKLREIGDPSFFAVLDDVDGFFKAVEHEPVAVEAALTEAVKHGRALVEGHSTPLKDAAGAARVVILINDSDFHLPFRQQACCG